MSTTIHLATDHAGFAHKEAVATWLRQEGYAVVDHGAIMLDSADDFPDFIGRAAEAVSRGDSTTRGIIFGGSGQGEALLANRYPGVRAVVYYGGNETMPKLTREHNNSNILSIGARFVSVDAAKQVIWEWLHTEPLTDPKYHRRNQKIEVLTKKIRS